MLADISLQVNIFRIISILAVASMLMLLTYEFKRTAMMFQQNSYRPERYRRWLKVSRDTTSYGRLIVLFLVLFGLSGFGVSRFATICVILFAIFMSSSLARKEYKKPLVFTSRVKRLLCCVAAVCLIITGASVTMSLCGLFGKIQPWYTAVITLLVIYTISHIVLLTANFMLRPVEIGINRKFYNHAKQKLQSNSDLKIIGITGSYGKTSTKHYLYRILSEEFETLMTPGSYNTTLGVVRTVNEMLKPYHEIFIVEMGAKQNGDIKEICDLVHPSVGIITAVGPQHLETFRTLENVRRTKFELIDSIPSDGTAVLNNDYPVIAETDVKNCDVFRYSVCENHNNKDASLAPTADYKVTQIEYRTSGSVFMLECPDGEKIEFETPLLGRHNIGNLTAAIAVARLLGMDIEKIKYAVRHIEPVEHRLSFKRMANGVTLLDDAFNSNPAGAAMAVEVLARMSEGAQSLIITPGMIELGAEQYDRNVELGRKIAEQKIKEVAIVGNYNKEAITEGLLNEGFDKARIHYFNTFLEANAWMVGFARRGDVVLIENDLPDTFK